MPFWGCIEPALRMLLLLSIIQYQQALSSCLLIRLLLMALQRSKIIRRAMAASKECFCQADSFRYLMLLPAAILLITGSEPKHIFPRDQLLLQYQSRFVLRNPWYRQERNSRSIRSIKRWLTFFCP